jgi:hypothetical protein
VSAPSVFEKLWNKGVDIAASVIASTRSAGIVALIATVAWRWKRIRDLQFEADKQRQQASISRELERAAELERRNILRNRLVSERNALAARAEATGHRREAYEIALAV